jgi:ribonucleoside-diphosphate reductase alpha chain
LNAPQKVIKRDGRSLDFDPDKIRQAIKKAMIATETLNERNLDEVVQRVLSALSERFGAEKPSSVEEIQNIVEQTLVQFNLYPTAKAYVVYRRERERVREEKKQILEKDFVDEVDKSFSLNALRLLASRYLLRDDGGRIIESPKQLFQRVAALMVISDILHDARIFDKEGTQAKRPSENLDATLYEGRRGFGENQGKRFDVPWNKHHLKRMHHLWSELNNGGKMRLSWSQLVEALERGDFENHVATYQEYYSMMVEKKFLPNSPTLFNAGAQLGQLSACFVLPIGDSMESIMKSAEQAALIFKSGGGIGINYSRLRPEGDRVASTAGTASGPVSFMRIIDTVTDVVKQGGKRRGANMGILEVSHPDIEKFIRSKYETGQFENFNISVLIPPNFWDHYVSGKPWPLRNPRDGSVWKEVDPRQLFRDVSRMAWETADPGALFLDKINADNPLREHWGNIDCVNPCGEEPMYPYESCNLGSLNVYAFVKHENGKASIDWNTLEKAVQVATRFLDNVIDLNNLPIEEIEKVSKSTRRIGLGLMGLADLLYALQVQYNSEEGFALMSRIVEFLAYHSITASVQLSKERGAFPLLNNSSYSKGKLPFEGFHHKEWWTLDWNRLAEEVKKNGTRNCHDLTIAPTGSISMIADTSSGLEPEFAIVFEKHVSVGNFYYIDPEFERQINADPSIGKTILKRISDNGGSLQGLDSIPEHFRRVFLVAYDIPWWDHIRAQYEMQKWISTAVSKTINMPSWTSVDDVENAYMFAYKLGLRGVTIYRDTSKGEQVLKTPTQRLNRYLALTPNNTREIMRKLGIKLSKETAKMGPVRETGRMPAAPEKTAVEFAKCPNCGSPHLAFQEACYRCLECGWSTCVIG